MNTTTTPAATAPVSTATRPHSPHSPHSPRPSHDPNKPVHTILIGSVQVSIWERDNQRGVNHSITAARRFLKNGQWQSTAGFFGEDLPKLAGALAGAHDWIRDRKAALATAAATTTGETVA